MFSTLKFLLIGLLENKIERTSLEFRFLRNVFWTLSSSIISRVLTLVSLLVTARILGQEDYGALGMIRSTTLTFASFAGLGLGLTATKFVAEYRNMHREKAQKIISLTYTFALVSGLFFCILFLFASDVISADLMNRAELSPEVKISSLILLFSTLIGAQTGIASGLESFKSIALTNLIAGIISLPLMILATYMYEIKGAVIGFCINQVLVFTILHFKVAKLLKQNLIPLSLSLGHLVNEFGTLWKFTIPAFLATLIPVFVLWLTNTWLIQLPNGYESLAVIDIANQWKEVVMYLPAILGTSILPILSSYSGNGNNDAKSYGKVMKIYFLVMTGITLTIILPVVIFSSKLLKLYGFHPTMDDELVLILYSTSSIFLIIASGIGQVLISQSRMWQGLVLNSLWGTVYLTLAHYFLRSDYGALGIAWAFFISYGVYAIGMCLYMQTKKNT